MYIPTPDDEVQMTRKIYGFNCYFGIIKKERLSLIDKIKKWLRIADEWIDYKYVYDIVDNGNFYDSKLNYNTDFFEFIETKYDLRNKLWNTVKGLTKNHIQEGFTIYGVVYGKDIHQSYDYGLSSMEFVGTDIFEDKNFIAPDLVKLIFDTVLDLPHIEILHTGEWDEEIQNQFVYKNYVENTNDTVPQAGIVVKHVSGDREKITTIYNPEFMVFIGKTELA